eukprot:366079-Chlamydomonas_euryale.AAC.7
MAAATQASVWESTAMQATCRWQPPHRRQFGSQLPCKRTCRWQPPHRHVPRRMTRATQTCTEDAAM